MATFRVGQRVRKIIQPNKGLEGVVVLTGPFPEGYITPEGNRIDSSCNIAVKFNSPWTSVEGVPFPSSVPAYGNSSEWEPILYDGNKTVEWSECLWMPEHMREAA